MNLHTYFQLPDALTVSELRERIGAKSDAQIRQWQHGYAERRPSPENCLAIERATGGMVTRNDLRPDDYWLIWPDLSAPGAANSEAVAQPAISQLAPSKEVTNHLMAEAFKDGVIKDRRDPSKPGRREIDTRAHAALKAGKS